MSTRDAGDAPNALTVSALTMQLRDHVEARFRGFWVVGELSNLKVHSSGHVYLTLKDPEARLDAVVWRTTAASLKWRPGEGTLVLAHNGTLPDMRRLKKLAGPEFTPAGQTDSELILGALLAWIERERAKAGTAHVPPPAKKSASTSVAQAATDHTAEPISDPLSDYGALEDFLHEINALGDMNLLFSDGRRLFCYHDVDGYNGLSWTRRQAPFCDVHLLDEEWSGRLAEDKARDQRGYVIASRPLTEGEPWQPCGHGRLLVIEHGDAVFGADVPGNAP